jgi:acyl-CoA synthetase (AMP-forming)/AMP-acid ligase II
LIPSPYAARLRYYPERTALASAGTRSTFGELNDRVACIAASLSRHGFKVGDRLAILLPNELEYIELVSACAWLGVVATELRRKVLATVGLRFAGFFLTAGHKKNSNETATKEKLSKVKSRIGTREFLVAATCAQPLAGRREGKAKM